MTRADLLVGVAFGLGGAGLLLVWCLLRIAARADHDAPEPPPRPESTSGVEVLQTWLDRSRPAPEPVPDEQLRPLFEDPTRIRLLPLVDEPPAGRAPYNHDRGARLLDEIERVLADVAAAAPVEATAPRLHAVRAPHAADGCCTDHDSPVCRHFRPCCGACPTLPVS